MTTRYQMKEMPDLQGTGEPITYPKMVMTGQTGTRELAEYIAMTSGFSKGVTEGIICELGEALAVMMRRNAHDPATSSLCLFKESMIFPANGRHKTVPS